MWSSQTQHGMTGMCENIDTFATIRVTQSAWQTVAYVCDSLTALKTQHRV